MDSFQRLLQTAVEQRASDIHLKAGAAPVLRVARELRPVDMPPLTEDQMREMAQTLLPAHFR